MQEQTPCIGHPLPLLEFASTTFRISSLMQEQTPCIGDPLPLLEFAPTTCKPSYSLNSQIKKGGLFFTGDHLFYNNYIV